MTDDERAGGRTLRRIREAVAAGWSDDEIVDGLERIPYHGVTGMSLRERHIVLATIADLRSDEAPIEDGPAPSHGSGLTRQEILAARREWQHDGRPRWNRIGISKATYIRHRRKFGLVPWPEGYRRRLTP